jgi:hypothetical protein
MPEREDHPFFGQSGRCVCQHCEVDLHCLRIGVWKCPSCGHEGDVVYEPFAVLIIPIDHEDVDLSTPEIFTKHRPWGYDLTDRSDYAG